MKFIVDNWVLILVALTSGGLLIWPLLKGASAGALNAGNAVLLINREKAVVVDVSEPEEYAKGHIKNAKAIPFGQLEAQLPAAVKNKALPVILVCPTGARANRAVGIAKKLGYEKAQALAGGLAAWKEANLPIVKG